MMGSNNCICRTWQWSTNYDFCVKYKSLNYYYYLLLCMASVAKMWEVIIALWRSSTWLLISNENLFLSLSLSYQTPTLIIFFCVCSHSSIQFAIMIIIIIFIRIHIQLLATHTQIESMRVWKFTRIGIYKSITIKFLSNNNK